MYIKEMTTIYLTVGDECIAMPQGFRDRHYRDLVYAVEGILNRPHKRIRAIDHVRRYFKGWGLDFGLRRSKAFVDAVAHSINYEV